MATDPAKKDDKKFFRGSADNFIHSILGEKPQVGKNNPYSHYLSRSVLLEEASPPKNIRATINISLGMLLSFIVWASVTQLDERASAPGSILPINFIQPVMHAEGGIVAKTLVKEGDFVKAGQPMVLLNEISSRAEYDSLKARDISLILRIERLRAFANGRPANFRNITNDFPEFIADQEQLLAASIRTREAQIAVVNAQIAERRKEQEGLLLQEDTLTEQAGLIQQEANIRKTLLDRGLTSKLVYIEAQKDLSDARGDLVQIRIAQAGNLASIAEAQQRILEIEERLRSDALTQLNLAAAEQAQVEAQLARLEDRVARTSIKSPVDGIVKGLIIRPVGGIILPGEVISEVVPTGQELVADIRISPRDIGHIKVGDPVLVKIETFNYARWGGVKGVIDRISAASFTESLVDEGRPFFKARVILETNYVGRDPRSNHITPSMTLVADIKTGEKSLMAYLIRPIYNSLSQSFSER